jgi:hypothetical protein
MAEIAASCIELATERSDSGASNAGGPPGGEKGLGIASHSAPVLRADSRAERGAAMAVVNAVVRALVSSPADRSAVSPTLSSDAVSSAGAL